MILGITWVFIIVFGFLIGWTIGWTIDESYNGEENKNTIVVHCEKPKTSEDVELCEFVQRQMDHRFPDE